MSQEAPVQSKPSGAVAAPVADNPSGTPAQAPGTPIDGALIQKFGDPSKIGMDVFAANLAKSYRELEGRMSQAPVAPAADPAAPAAAPPSAPPADAPAPAGGDAFAKFEARYVANGGKLTDQDFADVQKELNIPRAVAEDFLAYRQTAAQAVVSQVHQAVGGPEEYAQMAAWAKQNMPPAELMRLESALMSGKPDVTMPAVKAVYAQWALATGRQAGVPGGSVMPEGGPRRPADVSFQNWNEATAATDYARYQRDPMYRKQVNERLQASKSL